MDGDLRRTWEGILPKLSGERLAAVKKLMSGPISHKLECACKGFVNKELKDDPDRSGS
jgi:hypothetical protein